MAATMAAASSSAEPMKRKKKVDPIIEKRREDRKKRKIEKEIRKLVRVGRRLKPIDELEIPPKLIRERLLRQRKLPPLSEEETDYRSWILKEWANYKRVQSRVEINMIDRMMEAQTKALEELRIVSEELYEEALKEDSRFEKPYEAIGPVYTPPIENYDKLDGEYTDITKKWD